MPACCAPLPARSRAARPRPCKRRPPPTGTTTTRRPCSSTLRPRPHKPRTRRKPTSREQQRGIAMVIGILAAVLGLLFGTAAIVIPRIVNRHNQPEDESDSQAYLADSGRSAEEITQDNRSLQTQSETDAGSRTAGGTDTGKRN